MDVPPSFELRAVVVEPGGARIYQEAEWRDAIVIIACGEIELECLGGSRQRLDEGDVLWLVGRPIRAIHNRGADSAVLVAVSRRLAADVSSSVRS